jgi:DNA-binding PadR family transcriptional regulator
MSVPHAILGLLRAEPGHGYDLKRRFDRVFVAERQLAFGQVYATLERLEKSGRVRLDAVEQGEGPERRRYAITAAGREELERWIATPLDPETQIQTTLFMKVVLAILGGQPVGPMVDRERHAHLEKMRPLTALRRNSTLPVALLADLALFHLEADLRWLDLTAARVDELRRHVLAEMENA